VRVSEVRYEGGYLLSLQFGDRVAGKVDLQSQLFGGVFKPLRDSELFRQARLGPDLDTVEWPNGADFAPQFLYDLVVDAALSRKRGS